MTVYVILMRRLSLNNSSSRRGSGAAFYNNPPGLTLANVSPIPLYFLIALVLEIEVAIHALWPYSWAPSTWTFDFRSEIVSEVMDPFLEGFSCLGIPTYGSTVTRFINAITGDPLVGLLPSHGIPLFRMGIWAIRHFLTYF